MLEYNEITLRKYIIFENEPYEVLESHVFRKQQRKPVNAVKMKNLLTGRGYDATRQFLKQEKKIADKIVADIRKKIESGALEIKSGSEE